MKTGQKLNEWGDMKWIMPAIFLLIFSLCLAASFLVPLHSDDYGYWLKGFSWSNHVQHYQSWSGRFIVDYIACLVLMSPRWLNVCYAPLLVTSLCFLISYMPKVICRVNVAWWMPLVIFILYWVANPSLGQTSFWIVGVSNYLYPPVVCLLTFFLIFYLREHNFFLRLGLLPLGLLCGFSSEATSVSFCAGVVLLFLINFKDKKIVVNCLLSFIGGFIGLLFLVLAPGNFARLQEYKEWGEKSVLSKLASGFRASFLRVVKAWPILLIPVTTFILAKKKILLIDSRFRYSVLFFLIGCCAYFSMMVSPSFPPRAANPGFSWMLVSLSFALPLLKQWCGKFCKYYIGVATVLFGISYTLTFNGYLNNSYQDKVRLENLKYEQALGVNQTSVPSWYFSRNLRRGERIDPWESWAIGSFYGMSKTTEFIPTFNYGAIKRGSFISFTSNHPQKVEGLIFLNDILDGKQTLIAKLHPTNSLPKHIQIFIKNKEFNIVTEPGKNLVFLAGVPYIGLTGKLKINPRDLPSSKVILTD